MLSHSFRFLRFYSLKIKLFFIIFKPTLYGGWRHLYFLYPLIIVDSILGVKFLLDKCLKIRKLIIFIIIINCFVLIIWMIKNHPYQYNYFDLTFKDYYVNNFENDYWKLSYTEALKYILKKDKRDKIINLGWNKQEKDIKINPNTDIILIGSKKFIEEKMFNIKKQKIENIRLIACYDYNEIKDNMQDIANKYDGVLNTLGIKNLK